MTRTLSLVALALAPLALLGCGEPEGPATSGAGAAPPGPTTVQQTTVDEGPADTPSRRPPSSRSLAGTVCTALPPAFADHSVNGASAKPIQDDASVVCAMRLETSPGARPPGAFNGSGTGSKSIAGVGLHDRKKLSTLSTITFDAKRATGKQMLYVNLVVDLACDGVSRKILVVDPSDLGAPEPVADGYARYTVAASGAQWRVVGGITEVLPPHVGADPARNLDTFLETYPEACLANAATGDNGMPAGVVTSGILLVVGDSNTTTAEGWFVRRVTVGDDVYAM